MRVYGKDIFKAAEFFQKTTLKKVLERTKERNAPYDAHLTSDFYPCEFNITYHKEHDFWGGTFRFYEKGFNLYITIKDESIVRIFYKEEGYEQTISNDNLFSESRYNDILLFLEDHNKDYPDYKIKEKMENF